MTTHQPELFHDGAKCPDCGERVGVPDVLEGDPPENTANAAMMRCASCDHEWTEDDVREIARAWFAHGAYEQHMREQERRRDAMVSMAQSNTMSAADVRSAMGMLDDVEGEP